MLSADSIVQINSGSFEGTSGTASLPADVTAGSSVLIFLGMAGDGSASYSISNPSGFNLIGSGVWTGVKHGYSRVIMKPNSPGSELSWTLTVNGGSQQVCWVAIEVAGVDLEAFVTVANPLSGVYLEASDQAFDTVTTSRTSGTTNPSESYASLALAFFEATSSSTTVPTISDYTNGFYEIAGVNHANATRAMAVSLGVHASQSLGAVTSAVAISPSSYTYGLVVVLTGTDSKHAPNIDACSGFGIGTTTSLTSTGIFTGDGPPPWDEMVGTPAIVTTNPRTGSYCLELSATAALESLSWISSSSAANLDKLWGSQPPVGVPKLYFYFPTSLPSANAELASIEAGSLANGVVIRYVAASNKIGVKIGSGTEVLSDAAVAPDKWIGIDLFYDPRTSVHTFDWQVDYDDSDTLGAVVQTQATATGMTGAGITRFRLGWTQAVTATVRYADVVWTRSRKAYPIGPVNVRTLRVDPAGTVTVNGSTANFEVFTSNGGTSTAWNAVNARNALGDVPPTIGAASDGITQINVAGDSVNVPMETFTGAPNHCLRAARWYWAGWAKTSNPATCQFQVTDGGSTVRIIGDLGHHGFDNAALIWLTGMHKSTGSLFYLLDQTKVDALAFQWGFSNDANPDVGIHCAFVELVTQPAIVYGVTDAENGAFMVYVRQDPVSASVVSYLVTTPPGTRGATFAATIDGSDFSQYVAPNTTFEKVVGAVDIGQVTALALYPDPTP